MTKETFRLTLGAVLRALIGGAHRATEFAPQVGVLPSMLHRWFLGYSLPDAYELRCVARALHVPLDLIYMLVDETADRSTTTTQLAETAAKVVDDFKHGDLGKKRLSRGTTLLRGGQGA